jgi:hypothetical protein
LEFPSQIDLYTLDVSSSENGPWEPTIALPFKLSVFYTSHPSPREKPDGTYFADNALAMEGAFNSGPPISMISLYRVRTSDDSGCLDRIRYVDTSTRLLEEAISHGIEAHGTVAGWAAFNPFSSSRPYGDVKVFYRLTVKTPTDDYKTYGEITTPLKSGFTDSNTGLISLMPAPAMTHLAGKPIFYVGPKKN